MSEDEFRCVHFFGRVKFNGNAVTIVGNTNDHFTVLITSHADVNMLHRDAITLCNRANVGITGIYKNLVEDLVEARIHLDCAPYHMICFSVVDPAPIRVGVTTSNVAVRTHKNMLTQILLLVLCCRERHSV